MMLTDEMKAAISLIADESERLVWISGRAGTGKSTFLAHLKTELKPRNAVYLAPTGVAALSIGGQTIHSFFWIDPRAPVYLETKLDAERERRLYPLLATVETLVIDEISMVRADLLDEIDRRMRGAKRAAKRAARLPFGGARLIIFGDPYQLPPVEPDEASRAGALFEERYKSPFFFSSKVLRTRSRTMKRVDFTRVFRQSEAEFLSTLDRCRSGDVSDGDLRLLASRVLPEGRKPPPDHLVLTSTRAEAQRINAYRLAALPGPSRIYAASADGRFAKDIDEDELPVPRDLELKVGARVLLTANDPGGRWANGALAIVTGLDEAGATLRDDSGEFRVGFHVWRRVRYVLRGERIEEEATDQYGQLPLQPGWALTIHRAQGRTLERVFVDLSRGAFAAGQAYVAISRVTKLEGLVLRTRPRARDFFVHERVAVFLDYLDRHP
jgi:hypothetical protein